MTIAELTEEMHRFVASKGFYKQDSHRPQVPRNLAISLVLEASEVLEHFQWSEKAPDLEAFADELADVALYLLQLADISGVDLEASILRKLGKNAVREWPKQS